MINELHIQGLLAPFAPSQQAAKVARWVKDRGFRVAGLDALTTLEGEDKNALSEAVWAAYCHARGIPNVYRPQNVRRALDLLAEKFHYADAAALRDHQPAVHDAACEMLAHHEWRGHYLARQVLDDPDLRYAVNTAFKTWQEGWDDDLAALYAQRQREHVLESVAEYDDEELFEAVMEFLKAHPSDEYTYNQVAKGLRLAPGKESVLRVFKVLERLADPQQGTEYGVIKYKTRPSKASGKKAAAVYKWAPARRRLDAERHPNARRMEVKTVIREFLAAQPHQTVRAIRAAARAAFGQIDSKLVDEALGQLRDGGIVDYEVGARGAHLHFLVAGAKPSATESTCRQSANDGSPHDTDDGEEQAGGILFDFGLKPSPPSATTTDDDGCERISGGLLF